MLVTVKRVAKKSNYTIGHLFVDGQFLCDTLEDTDRGLLASDSLDKIKKAKVYGETAIPIGKYKVVLNVVSPRYSKVDYYVKNMNGGRMPRLQDVKGWDGVLLHPGNTVKDTLGCILVGYNKKKGELIDSKKAFSLLYEKLLEAEDTIWLEIV